MARGFAAALALACLLAAPTVSADWLMEGHDAQGTGHAERAAPGWDDIALSVQLPLGGFVTGNGDTSDAVVVGRVAYMALRDRTVPPFQPTYGLFAIHLDTGEAGVIASFAIPPPALADGGFTGDHPVLASDGAKVFVLFFGQLFVFDVATGTFREPIELPLPPIPAVPPQPGLNVPSHVVPLCCTSSKMVVDQGFVYVALETDFSKSTPVYVYKLDAATGVLEGSWPMVPADTGQPVCNLGGISSSARSVAPGLNLLDLRAFDGIAVLASGISQSDGGGIDGAPPMPQEAFIEANGERYQAFDTKTNTTLWASTIFLQNANVRDLPARPLIADERLVVEHDLVVACGIYSGQREALRNWLNFRNNIKPDFGSGMAAAGGRVFDAFANILCSLDRDLVCGWSVELDETFQAGPLLVAGRTVMGFTSPTEFGSPWTLRTFDVASGVPGWSHVFSLPATMMAADGVVIVIEHDGRVTALGTTGASLRPSVVPSSVYPGPSEPFTVDLSGTEATPLPLGAPTEFRVDWADGQIDGWQSSPRFNHSYAAGGDVAPRFYVRNAAGQSSSKTLTFHVGAIDPAAPWYNVIFLPRYSNATFTAIGLLATVLGALIGFALRGRKRRRMHREMQALESSFRATRDDPDKCEPMLRDKKERFRDLLKRRKLEEDQFGILSDRADEFLGRIRMGTVEEDFAFLPLGVARILQRMLRDGRVTAAERSFVVSAVHQDTILSNHQKTKVIAQVEKWFRSDTSS